MSDSSSSSAEIHRDENLRLRQQQQQTHPRQLFELTAVQSTSLLVAYWRDMESRHNPNPLIRDPTAQVLLDALLSPSQRQDFETSPMRPYGLECLAVRTRAIDDWLIQATKATTTKQRQFVNLGAGMCCRPYRLDDLKGNQHQHQHNNEQQQQYHHAWWEVDSDLALLSVKRSVLHAAGYQPHLPVVDVSVDLSGPETSSLADSLQRHGFESSSPDIQTDWIAEGLLAYLEPHQHAKLFRATAALSVAGSRMALTVVEPAMSDFWETLGASLPYQDLVPIDRVLNAAMGFGWSVDQHIRPHDWSRLYPGRGEHLPGFNVVFLVKDQ